MAKERDVSNPIMKTYLSISDSPTGKRIHARVCARQTGLDRRGTGRTVSQAVDRALSKLKKSPQETIKK